MMCRLIHLLILMMKIWIILNHWQHKTKNPMQVQTPASAGVFLCGSVSQ
jgi:hypothetical protein